MIQAKGGARPLYEKIEKDLAEKIQGGFYAPGARIPSENELIREYNVSRITAGKALTQLEEAGYITRIQGRGSFVKKAEFPAGDARQTASSATKKIGLIIPEYCDYHSSQIIRGVLDSLKFPSYFVDIVLNCSGTSENFALNHFVSNGYAGIILFPTDCELYSDTILQMHLNKYPFILVDRAFPGIGCSTITCNNTLGAKLATEHLLSLGHKKIAFLTDSSFKEQITSIRYNSYVNSMSALRLPVMPYENPFQGENKNDLQKAFLRDVSTGKITGLIAANSHIALKAYHLCMHNGIRIPEQLSIVCFDRPIYAEADGISLTYIEQGSYQMGQQAAEVLMQQSEAGDSGVNRQITLRPKLILGNSTAERG